MASIYASKDLPFPLEQLKTFHSFHSYNWNADATFKNGLKSIDQTNPTQILKAKHFYFSRYITPIDIDQYLLWEKYIDTTKQDHANPPHVDIFERFEAYDFDRDERFLNGLPNIVAGLVKKQAALDKEAYDREMTKAKAYYYSKCVACNSLCGFWCIYIPTYLIVYAYRLVEPFDFVEYLRWHDEKNKNDAPACPYAHLWQHKVKQDSKPSHADHSTKTFLRVTSPFANQGALRLTLSSPHTLNILTSRRLAQISSTIAQCTSDPNITSLILSADTDTPEAPQSVDRDAPIVHRDMRVFSEGLPLQQTVNTARGSSAPEKAIDALLRSYHRLSYDLHAFSFSPINKPVITLIDGRFDWTCLTLSTCGTIRIITENAVLPSPDSFARLHDPLLGLPFLSRLVSLSTSTTKPAHALPPRGCALYLSLASPDLHLRGPDLLKLGMADYFVPSSKLDDVLKGVVGNAGCPAPHTAKAVEIALSAEKVYPGPAKIDVWRREVEECFDVSVRFWLENYAIHLTFEECLLLEHRVGRRWRRSADFRAWLAAREVRPSSLPNIGLSTFTIQGETFTPIWTPASLSDVSDATVDTFFSFPTSEEDGELAFVGQMEVVPEDIVTFEPGEDDAQGEVVDERFVEGLSAQIKAIGLGAKDEADDGEVVTCPVTGMVGKRPAEHP
ncbi:hypothetical protein BC938DRAFT_479131 [Jimgerdemannia flammicorona]|uniref:3-hydroxyisobutyryl-CoA hydrolase n=1 Tax=Jimgerdemannia flammicorona TaxID=994334 RepID=A0A433QLJ6_9FUNG|nr:hypothetical protein BC938DRAFT_479131 [Jimgerdemannia flammicorona]